MFVPMSVNDFLERAETVYPDRIAFVDEPDQPAAPLGPLTYGQLAAAARAQAAALDDLDVPIGGRVAIVSHNCARLLTSFFGVSGSGRVLVPVNFRPRANRGRVHRRTQRRGRPARRPRARRGARQCHGASPIRARRERRGDLPRGSGRRIVGRRRVGHGHHQLHVGHHGPSQGRAAHAPQPLDERDAHGPAPRGQ